MGSRGGAERKELVHAEARRRGEGEARRRKGGSCGPPAIDRTLAPFVIAPKAPPIPSAPPSLLRASA